MDLKSEAIPYDIDVREEMADMILHRYSRNQKLSPDQLWNEVYDILQDKYFGMPLLFFNKESVDHLLHSMDNQNVPQSGHDMLIEDPISSGTIPELHLHTVPQNSKTFHGDSKNASVLLVQQQREIEILQDLVYAQKLGTQVQQIIKQLEQELEEHLSNQDLC
ncbi:hypothetical protein HDV02_005800 [Globomyces sp. JEL0801]|nr:hypothetical protein HDV02_005800 [Globomyces sp. JEL0801]